MRSAMDRTRSFDDTVPRARARNGRERARGLDRSRAGWLPNRVTKVTPSGPQAAAVERLRHPPASAAGLGIRGYARRPAAGPDSRRRGSALPSRTR
jgi:hypothetical protein